MAQLTDTLNAVNSGKPIVDPGPAAPSMLGALANIGTGAVEGFMSGLDMRDNMNRRAASDQAARLATQERDALNSAAQGVLDVQLQASQDAVAAEGVDMLRRAGAEFDVPENVGNAARNLVRTMSAVRQGRVGRAAYDLQLEKNMSDLFQQFPEQKAQIAQYMHSQGIDHYMFRAFRADAQMAQTGADVQAAARQTQANVAIEAGFDPRGSSLEDLAARGRDVIAARATAEANRQRAEDARADQTLENADRERILKETSEAAANNIITQYGLMVGPRIEQAQLLIAAAGDDAQLQATLGDVRVTAIAALRAAQGRAIIEVAASGNSQEARTQVNEYFDSQIEALDSLFGVGARQNITAAQSLAAGLAIDMGRALPIYGRLSAAVGSAGANAIINDLVTGVPGLDPTMLEAAKREMRNFDPTRPNGVMSLARAISYMRGETALADLTAEEAPNFIRLNASAMVANRTALLSGNQGALEPFRTQYGGVLEAVSELAPTTTTGASLWRGASTVFTRESRRALELSLRDDPEYGEALITGSRGAAAHVLNIAKNTGDSPYKVMYFPETRNFRPVLTREAYDSWAADQGATIRAGRGAAGALAGGMLPGPLAAIPSYEEMRSADNVPADIRQRTAAANNAIQHLIATDQYDEGIPSTLTAIERANLYGAGRTPASMSSAGGTPTQAQEFERLRTGAMTGFQELLVGTVNSPRGPNSNNSNQPAPPRDQVQTLARTTFEAAGVPWEVTNRLAMKESGWDTEADNGTAQGVFQVKDFNGSWEQNIEAGLDHWLAAGRGARAALGRAPTPADQYVMYQQGPSGGAALLRPANANQPAWEVLLPFYQREYGDSAERVAKSAVTRNGGTLNMTAAQFAQSIRDYWNR